MLARNRGISVPRAHSAQHGSHRFSSAQFLSILRVYLLRFASCAPIFFSHLEAPHFPLSHLAWYLTIFLWTLSTLFHRFSHLEAPHFHDVFARDSAEQPPC